MSLEKQKLILLTHSKNMLNAAKSEDWQQFSALDSAWQDQLKAAVDIYGEQLNTISEQLLEDNQNIQQKIKFAQAKLANELQQNNKSHSSVKQYLK